MTATIINMLLIIAGGIAGLLIKSRIRQSMTDGLLAAMGLAVLAVGLIGVVKTDDLLCLIVCLALGTFVGEILNIEKGLERFGNSLHGFMKRFAKKEESRFTEGFVSATVLFCVGAMAIMGSLEAGINGNYTIIVSKGIIDCVVSVTFAATMGIGVLFSALTVGIYQGAITLLAGFAAPFLTETVVSEMSATGSLLIVGISVNMLRLSPVKLKIGNMLPAIFLPLAYVPIASALSGFFFK
ncbi:MAG: DUF554 domain-containing protein [Defluviitaleaceae bacterium]|nr:DUF554 domain-containing protein [Defluviitaleaceae bacterium]